MTGSDDDDFEALIESAYAEAEVLQGQIGDDRLTRVTPSPSRPGVDRGVAGSLVQTRDRLRRDHLDRIGPPWQDWWTGVPFVVMVASGIGLGWVAALTPSATGVAVFVVVVLCLVIGGCGWVLYVRRGPVTGEGPLNREIVAERRIARELESGLVGSSWVVLHDRLLPQTEHRVPFLAVGPSGVALIAVMPPGPYLIMKPVGVMAGDDELTQGWLVTRLWEIRYLVKHLIADPSRDLGFTGPVMGLAVIGYDLATKVPTGWSSQAPHRIDDYPIRTAASAGKFLRHLPVTLGPAHVDQLVRLIDHRCPPAPHP